MSFGGVQADSCTISVDDVTAVWNTGVPAPAAAESPVLTIAVDNAGILSKQVASTADTLDNSFAAPVGGTSI